MVERPLSWPPSVSRAALAWPCSSATDRRRRPIDPSRQVLRRSRAASPAGGRRTWKRARRVRRRPRPVRSAPPRSHLRQRPEPEHRSSRQRTALSFSARCTSRPICHRRRRPSDHRTTRFTSAVSTSGSNRATRASWDDVINHGRSLPGVSSGCADRWRKSGKDSRLNWKSVDFLCMDGINGRAFKPGHRRFSHDGALHDRHQAGR